MSAAQDEDVLESHADELFGPAPPDDDDEEEETPPIAAKAVEEDEEDDEDAKPPSRSKPEAVEAEAEPAAPDSDGDGDELARVKAEAERREKALQAELGKLRRERRQRALAEGTQGTTAPVRPAEVPTVTPPIPDEKPGGKIPIRVDGQDVYVDEEAYRQSSAEIAREEAAKVYEERTRPKPEELLAQEMNREAQAFLSADPEQVEHRRQVIEVANKADDYIALALQDVIAREGYQPQSVQDLKTLIRAAGIDQQVAEYFPAVAPLVDEFVDACAANKPSWKRSILERMASATHAPPTPIPDSDAPERDRAPKLAQLTNTPQSLARKGGTRSPSPSAEEAEFEQLEKAYFKDPVFFGDSDFTRYEELGKKLGRTGVE